MTGRRRICRPRSHHPHLSGLETREQADDLMTYVSFLHVLSFAWDFSLSNLRIVAADDGYSDGPTTDQNRSARSTCASVTFTTPM